MQTGKTGPEDPAALKEVLSDVTLFADAGCGIRLRTYQRGVAEAIVTSVLRQQGKSFVVMFPRQSGKNELQAQIESYLLMLFSQEGGEIVKVSPTWKPQSLNAMRRLESTLRRNIITKDLWQKESGHIYRIGSARTIFLSGAPDANIVGATASLLLEVDEAQDIRPDKFDRDIAPMAAARNATRVFWGTAWTADTLLARELAAADGKARLAFTVDADAVAAEVPAYSAFMSAQIARFGRQHPLIRTQYFCEEIGGENRLFNEKRLSAMQGRHPSLSSPDESGGMIVFLIDVAGADETSPQGAETAASADRRDATAVTICQICFPESENETECSSARLPVWQVLRRVQWVNLPFTGQYARLRALREDWRPRHIVIDATGVGAGLASFLLRGSEGTQVHPFVFSSASKSRLGWDFLAILDTGRWREFRAETPPNNDEQSALQALFFRQLRSCQSELRPGPDKRMRWGVPEGLRDPHNGEILHDDLVFSAALAAVIDRDLTGEPAETLIIPAADPLRDLDRGF